MTQPLPELGRAYLILLQPGLHSSRLVGISANIVSLPGVVSVTDMAAISRETLDWMLLPDEYKYRPTRKARRRAAS